MTGSYVIRDAVDLYSRLVAGYPDRMTSVGWKVPWVAYTLAVVDSHADHLDWSVEHHGRHVTSGHTNKTGPDSTQTAWLAACQAALAHCNLYAGGL